MAHLHHTDEPIDIVLIVCKNICLANVWRDNMLARIATQRLNVLTMLFGSLELQSLAHTIHLLHFLLYEDVYLSLEDASG